MGNGPSKHSYFHHKNRLGDFAIIDITVNGDVDRAKEWSRFRNKNEVFYRQDSADFALIIS